MTLKTTNINHKDKTKEIDFYYEKLISDLNFPFDVRVIDSEGENIIAGDMVTAISVNNYFELYGVLLDVKKGKKRFVVPLCDIEVIDKRSKNAKVIKLFLEWWWNLSAR